MKNKEKPFLLPKNYVCGSPVCQMLGTNFFVNYRDIPPHIGVVRHQWWFAILPSGILLIIGGGLTNTKYADGSMWMAWNSKKWILNELSNENQLNH